MRVSGLVKWGVAMGGLMTRIDDDGDLLCNVYNFYLVIC